jgi:hypothetical protein
MPKPVCQSEDAEFRKEILTPIAIVYQAVSLAELTSLVEMGNGSVVVVRENTVHMAHQSAEDCVLTEASSVISQSSKEKAQREIPPGLL